MIKTQRLTPEIYYKESRDFQFFGRVYDVIFNYIKTNVDLMENFPISNFTDSKLIELLCRTLGFSNKLDYRNDDLNAVCNVFINLMRYKGSVEALNILVKTILNVEGINKGYDIYISKPNPIKNISIKIPDVITNSEIKLLEDVLEYILPIGVLYDIQTVSVINTDEMGKLKVEEASQISKLVDNNKNYSNIFIAQDSEEMTTTGQEREPETLFGEVENPLVGDMRYSRVVDTTKSQINSDTDDNSNNEE